MMILQAGVLVANVALVPADVLALEAGTQTRPPVAVSAAAPLRQALIVAPAPSGGTMAFDMDGYAALLRLLGFSVSTVVAETRPELESELRRFAAEVKTGGEVAVFALGTSWARGKDLYLAQAAPPDLAAHPEGLMTEGVAFADLLRRIGERGPKDVVVIVDSCRPVQGGDDCRTATSALPDGVSALVASRRRGADYAPVARLASLRPELLPLMRQADLSFFSLYSALHGRLADTDMILSATPSLSRSFAFLPGDFFAKLPVSCNQVAATGDPSALLERRLREQADSCAEEARTYDFSPHFAQKLGIVREQLAYLRAAAAGCDAAATAGFLRSYPDSPLRPAVDALRIECEQAERDAEARAAAQRLAQQEQDASAAKALEEARRERLAREEAQSRPFEIAPPTPAVSNGSRACAAYMSSYFKQWSLPNQLALGFISDAYAPIVSYYGKTVTRNEIVQEKTKFAARWPERDYSVQEGKYTLSGDVCRITGIIRWRATRPPGKSAQGLSEFDITVALGQPPRITAENSKVLSRDP